MKIKPERWRDRAISKCVGVAEEGWHFVSTGEPSGWIDTIKNLLEKEQNKQTITLHKK